MKRVWFAVFIGFLIGGITGVGLSRYSRSRNSGLPVVAASVNDDVILTDLYHARLRQKFGAQVLTQMVEQSLIAQKALSARITLSQTEENELAGQIKKIRNEFARPAYAAERRAELLSRKLILKEITQKQMREIYDEFRDEIIEYELFGFITATESDAASAMKGLREGLSFEQVSKTWSIVHIQEARIGLLTLPIIRSKMGEAAANDIETAKSGEIVGPFYCNQGLMVLKVGRINRSYPELQRHIEDILITSRQVAFARELFQGAKLKSDFFDKPMAGTRPSEGPLKLDPNDSKVSRFAPPSATPTGTLPGNEQNTRLPGLDPQHPQDIKPGLPTPVVRISPAPLQVLPKPTREVTPGNSTWLKDGPPVQPREIEKPELDSRLPSPKVLTP